MKHLKWSCISCALFLAFCQLGANRNAVAQCSSQARITAQRLLQDVYEGAWSGGSLPAFKDALGLTIDDGDPPPAPIVVTKRYAIASQAAIVGGCRFTVEFDRQGLITEDLDFQPTIGKEIRNIWVLCDKSGCKVDLNEKRFGFPPHVGHDGLLRWLKKLRGGDRSEKVAVLEQRIRSL